MIYEWSRCTDYWWGTGAPDIKVLHWKHNFYTHWILTIQTKFENLVFTNAKRIESNHPLLYSWPHPCCIASLTVLMKKILFAVLNIHKIHKKTTKKFSFSLKFYFFFSFYKFPLLSEHNMIENVVNLGNWFIKCMFFKD